MLFFVFVLRNRNTETVTSSGTELTSGITVHQPCCPCLHPMQNEPGGPRCSPGRAASQYVPFPALSAQLENLRRELPADLVDRPDPCPVLAIGSLGKSCVKFILISLSNVNCEQGRLTGCCRVFWFEAAGELLMGSHLSHVCNV